MVGVDQVLPPSWVTLEYRGELTKAPFWDWLNWVQVTMALPLP
jgi:hypothetical protein